SLPRPVRAVIFDMDGLLVDSEVVYCEALTAQTAAMGYVLPLSVMKRMIGHTWAGSTQVLREHFGEAFDTEALREGSVKRFYELAQAEIALKAGVLELLDLLDAFGLPRAIATSSRRMDVEHHLGAHGLMDRFHAVKAQGDYARGKPHPDPYLRAAEALGVPPQDCLALEDSHNGVRAAHAAGMMTIMVPDMLDPTEEMRTLCVRIAGDLHEVRELLEAQRR
ncbi:MAG TPA: HAD family phosphatase, partial [Phenylobacterium sp.]